MLDLTFDARLFNSYVRSVKRIKSRHILVSCIDSRIRSLALKVVFRDVKDSEYMVVVRNSPDGNDIVLGFSGVKNAFRTYAEINEHVLYISEGQEEGDEKSDIVITPFDGKVVLKNEVAVKALGEIFPEGTFVFPNFPAPYFTGLHPLIKSHFIIRYLYPGRSRSIADVVEEATNFAVANSETSEISLIRSDFTLLLRNMISARVLRGDSVTVSGPKSVSSFERRFLKYYYRKYVMVSPSTLFDYEAL